MASTYLQRTPSGAGNRKTFTISFWVKRSKIGGSQSILNNSDNSGLNGTYFEFDGNNKLLYFDFGGSSYETPRFTTNRLFKDCNAFFHIVVAVDTTQATESNRFKLYVNGVQETSFATSNYPSQNADTRWNTTNQFMIGSLSGSSKFFDGVISHFHFCDGTALAPTVFGSTDSTTGEWKINTSPSFTLGTNGFTVLKDGNTITDQSTNSNNFSLGGGTLTKTEDCPDNVFATMNLLENHQQQGTYTNGNNTYQTNSSNYTYNSSTLGVNTGKFYWEVKYAAKSGSVYSQIGITSTQPTDTNQELGHFANDWSYSIETTNPYYRNNNTNTSYGAAYTVGDIIGVALDLDNNKLYFSKNGTFQNSGVPTSGSTGTGAISITAPSSTPLGFYFPSVAHYDGSSNSTFQANFGNGYFGTTAVSSAGTNASGNGIFEYDCPSGYTALSTKGLNL